MKGRIYTHSSGWWIVHCGHPTANWPYYLVPADRSVPVIVSWNGLGFRTLEASLSVVRGLIRGEHAYTTEDCARGVGRVLGVTADGKALPWLEPQRAALHGPITERKVA